VNVMVSTQSPVQSRGSSITVKGKHWALFALIFLVEVLQSSTSLAGFPGPGRYFAYQWSVSYGNGFTRRGLLGSLLRMVHLDNGSYLLIAACGWLITLALFLLVARTLLHLLAPLEPMTRSVLLIVLLLSPVTTGILVQTTGDPIQLILLAYITLTLFIFKIGRGVILPFLVLSLFGAASVLIHEASVFFVAPPLLLVSLFFRRSRVDHAALVGYIFGAVPAMLMVIYFTQNHAMPAVAPMHLGATPMISHSKMELGTFSSLLAEENAARFHSGIRGYLLTARDAVGALLLPLFFVFLMSRLSHRRYLFTFLISLLISAPLWMIAHDWGRFSSCLFILTLVGLPSNTSESTLPQAGLTPVLLGILLVLSGLTTTGTLHEYIIKGLGGDNNTLLATLLLCSISIWLLTPTHPQPQMIGGDR
jgi:hypothetical protein